MLVFRMDAFNLTDIIARAQANEPSAFDVLVDMYGRRLYGYFYRATGRRDEAEDLLQELFVRLVGTIGHYQHDGRFESWLFRIATNLVRDRIRRGRSSREVAQSVEGDWARPISDLRREPPAHALDQLDSAEDIDRLGRAIQELPEPERMVILLRHFAQMPFQEIADVMGTPLGTALARAHRGLARLRQLMAVETGGRESAPGEK